VTFDLPPGSNRVLSAESSVFRKLSGSSTGGLTGDVPKPTVRGAS
jgi:hypothetical protein